MEKFSCFRAPRRRTYLKIIKISLNICSFGVRFDNSRPSLRFLRKLTTTNGMVNAATVVSFCVYSSQIIVAFEITRCTETTTTMYFVDLQRANVAHNIQINTILLMSLCAGNFYFRALVHAHVLRHSIVPSSNVSAFSGDRTSKLAAHRFITYIFSSFDHMKNEREQHLNRHVEFE